MMISNLQDIYGFDTQWVKIEKEWRFRLALFDLINNKPLADGIYDEENNESIKEFLTKSVAPKDYMAVVTNPGNEYENIMAELNFKHQLCTFHLEKKLWDLINTEANTLGKEYRKQLKKENSKMSSTKLNEKCDDWKKGYKKYVEGYVELFMAFREQQSWQKAENYINLLKREIHTFPDYLADYITQNFMPIYKKYIIFFK